MMSANESINSRLVRLSIPFIVAVIVGIYYLSEIVPFPYDEYEKHINQLQRNDAELNEAIVLIRFGILKYYGPIAQAENSEDEVLNILRERLKKYPNPTIQAKFNALQEVINKKRELTNNFERMNPVLINAIIHFSSILGELIESESNNQLVETCSQ